MFYMISRLRATSSKSYFEVILLSRKIFFAMGAEKSSYRTYRTYPQTIFRNSKNSFLNFEKCATPPPSDTIWNPTLYLSVYILCSIRFFALRCTASDIKTGQLAAQL